MTSVLQDRGGRALLSLADLLGQYEDLSSASSSFRTSNLPVPFGAGDNVLRVASTLLPEMNSLLKASPADMSPTPST